MCRWFFLWGVAGTISALFPHGYILVPKVALWVFGMSVTSPAPELPSSDTRSGAVKAGTCSQVPLFSLAPHQTEAAALGWGWVEDVCVSESRPSPRQKCWECLSGFFLPCHLHRVFQEMPLTGGKCMAGTSEECHSY